MIQRKFLPMDLSVFLNADYTQHYGSCISYQSVEQTDVHKDYAGFFPESYHEDNTRIQQLWFGPEDVDYDYLGEVFGMEVKTVSSILQPPGNVVTMHRDTFFKFKNEYPDDTRLRVRANMYLQDWQPGHVIHYQDQDKKWQSSTHWKAGEGFLWDDQHLHLSANAGLVNKYTLQVSGFLL